MDPLTTARVKLWGETIGAVVWLDDQGCAAFEYDPDFLKKGLDLAPIHLPIADAGSGFVFSFPNIDPVTFMGLPGLLAGCLPDMWGNKIIDSWLRRNGRDPNSFNPVERLCYTGTRGMGALEFKPGLGQSFLNKSVPVEVDGLIELAREVMAERTQIDVNTSGSEKEKAEAMLDILRVGTSAGGAVPKAIIAMNDKGHIISGQAENTPGDYAHWILKFDDVQTENAQSFDSSSPESGRIEYAYCLMALQAGIEMHECRLLEENNRAHFMTRRFDRVDGQKVHMLSLACMAHFGWNPPGAYGYEDAFMIMRRLGLPYPEHEQMFRRMVFNAVARNYDDHTKNISFIMDKDGTWKLSPAYDLIYSYNPAELLGDRHKMKINGKQKNFTGKDFAIVAKSMGINKPDRIVDQVLDSVADWPEHAGKAGLSREKTGMIMNMILGPEFAGYSIK